MKCTHGCGFNIIVKDKSKLDIKNMRKLINKWLKTDYGNYAGEVHYSSIKPKIIAEEYIENLEGDVWDYKYFCFNGKPQFIMFCTERNSGVVRGSFFDLKWRDLNFRYFTHNKLDSENIPVPKNLDLMNEIAEKLCKDFKHVRIDLYNVNGKIYFGEFTFTSFGGNLKFIPDGKSEELGNLLNLGRLQDDSKGVLCS